MERAKPGGTASPLIARLQACGMCDQQQAGEARRNRFAAHRAVAGL
jgi:hypothetical protein